MLYALLQNIAASDAIRACGGSVTETRDKLEDFLQRALKQASWVKGNFSTDFGISKNHSAGGAHVRAAGKRRSQRREFTDCNVCGKRNLSPFIFLEQQDISRLDLLNFVSHRIVKPGVHFEDEHPGHLAPIDDGEDEEAKVQNVAARLIKKIRCMSMQSIFVLAHGKARSIL